MFHMKRTVTAFFIWSVVVTALPAMAQDVQQKYAAEITAAELREHLTILASDEMEGRETGHKGQRMAAAYIKKQFEKMGLQPAASDTGYFQKFDLTEADFSGISVFNENDSLQMFDDFFSYTSIDQLKLEDKEVVFVGYGIADSTYNDYADKDVKGKVVIMLEGEPMKEGKSLLTGTAEYSDWSYDQSKKIFQARDLGAAAIISLQPEYDQIINRIRRYLENPRMRLKSETPEGNVTPVLVMGPKAVENLFPEWNWKSDMQKLESTYAPVTHTLATNLSIVFNNKKKDLYAVNVLGMVPGTTYKDQYLFVTAHYDHIGITNGEINNGADDDGSGTSALLEIAESFMMAYKDGVKPARNVVFMLVSGEEKGLLGSEYYTDHPIYPLDSTIADLNVDMIGRTDYDHEGDSTKYIYLIGSGMLSSELKQLSEEVNEKYTNLELDYKYDDPADPNRFYYRSDHYNFAKNGIPVIFYFRGVHEDYHRPTDTVEKIEFDTIEYVARLIFYTAWEIANRPEMFNLDVEQNSQQ